MSKKRPVRGPINHTASTVEPPRLLRLVDVAIRTRLSKSEIYRRIKAGTFPCSLKVGARAVAWRESDIHDWIASLS
ncbi:phage transcriptional regulator AlpA [Burkholderia contaminans]|uniref:helix-turn-helix transcriptional regulator n=1 Tax=Burkholderia contaminans TaxID=488447 RepID=UPI00145321C2|nr:AlpA family phage regulatory protein [Burkholderia contaminans]VWD38535.1 phage transcriptional regulator AlpA [Burkholderia contaminans]